MATKILSTITAITLTAALAASAGAQTERVIDPSTVSANVGPVWSAHVAQEIFGPNSESVKVAIPGVFIARYADAEAVEGGTVTVAPGQSAVFTYKLSGAKLAEAIEAGDLSYQNASAAPLSGFLFTQGRDGGGGQKGDDFVSYTVTAGENAVEVSGNQFAFNVPDVEMVSVAGEEEPEDRQITLTLTIDPPTQNRFSTGGQNFPRYPISSTSTQNTVVIARISPAYTLAVSPSATSEDVNRAEINLEDPSMLTATSSNPLLQVGGFGDSDMSGIKLSSVTANRTTVLTGTPVNVADATTQFTAGTTDMLRIAVTGNFSASDRLFLSTTTTGNPTYNQRNDLLLTVSADGTTAEGAKPLAGTGAIPIGTEHVLYYVPGGQIQRGSIAVSYTLDFAASTARDSTTAGKDLTLEYSGINFTNYAYAIPNPTVADVGNLRVRCEGASDCTVFFSCMDQAGMRVGGFERMSIGAGVTDHISSMELATMLGVDSWTGRLACSLHSSSRVSVQLLVRSGGTLTNNTFIGGLDASR